MSVLCEQVTTEKRHAPRKKCFLRGFLYVGKSIYAVNCLVRDISDTGARLICEGRLSTADIIDLHIPIKGQTFHARVQWHVNDQFGIAFVDPSILGDETPASNEISDRVARVETEIAGLKQMIRRLHKGTDGKIEAA